MGKTRIGWIKGMLLLSMFFTALSSNTFAKEEITSDGGVLLLREIDRKLYLTNRLA